MEMNCPKEFVNIPESILDNLIQREFNYGRATDTYRWVMDHLSDPDIGRQFKGMLYEESDPFTFPSNIPKSRTQIHPLVRYVRTLMVKELLNEDARDDIHRLHQYALLHYGISRPGILFVDDRSVLRTELYRLTRALWYCLRRLS